MCEASILGFYLTFLNGDTLTQQAIFADAFMGFVEFTPVPNQANSLTKPDDILVALNQKTAPPASGNEVIPSLTLTNYGFDWQATAANTISAADSPSGVEDYTAEEPKYKTSCVE